MIGKKVLLIDDDPDFLQLTGLIFKKDGAQVFTAYDGIDGISKLFAHQPDLIILDIMMPRGNGFEVCQRIRQATNTPVIVLSALHREHDILQSLKAGADGFLSKPINPEILLARAKAVLRRRDGQDDSYQAAFRYDDGYLKIDFDKHRVQIKNDRIKLTPVEFRLLVYLASNPDKVLSFEQILHNVWGSEYAGSRDYVHVYISYLRSKIEVDARNPSYILSVHGEGYIFERRDFARVPFSKSSIVQMSCIIIWLLCKISENYVQAADILPTILS